MNYGEFLSSFLIDLQRLFRVELSTSDLTYSQILAIFVKIAKIDQKWYLEWNYD